jgi:hypothetical protein
MFYSMLFQPKTATKLIGSFAAMRELTCPQGVDQRWLAQMLSTSCLRALEPRSQALSQAQCIDLPRVQRNRHRTAVFPISQDFISGKYWSNAAWPA